ncbi:MAG: hypothetical protein HY998_00150 [candidate division NC10 bacterium]|nr:hypothetical protein [candidate division NC10 bacterium]
MADFAQALDLSYFNPKAYGETFNLSTVYVTWEEIARMVVEVTGSSSEIKVIPREEWKGSAFLADPWALDDHRAREILGYRPGQEEPEAKTSLKAAIAHCWKAMGKG